MCELVKTLAALKRLGAWKSGDQSVEALFEATGKDMQQIIDTIKVNEKDQADRTARLIRVEQDVKEIRDTMVSKEDLRAFKDELIPAIQKAAQFDLVKKGANWKVIGAFAIGFFVMLLLFSFGIRGLDTAASIVNNTVGKI